MAQLAGRSQPRQVGLHAASAGRRLRGHVCRGGVRRRFRDAIFLLDQPAGAAERNDCRGRGEVAAMAADRLATGVPGLDELLGGGLIPGTLTVVCGATGIGKTQLGVQFAACSRHTPCAVNPGNGTRSVPTTDSRGILFDMSSRGDSQSHAEYARRICNWELNAVDPDAVPALDRFFEPSRQHGDYLHVFRYHGRRVTRRDLDWDDWNQWQAELNSRLRSAIAFFYGNFVNGCRRVVIDGIEPVDRPAESIQFNLFEYVYHQILRKDPEWVARDLFREQYRKHADEAAAHAYDPAQ